MSIKDYEFFVGDKVRLVGEAWDHIPGLRSGLEDSVKDAIEYLSGDKHYELESTGVTIYFDDVRWKAELVEAGAARINRQLENFHKFMGLDTELEVELANDSKLPRVEDYTAGIMTDEEVEKANRRRDELAAKRSDDAQVIATAVGKVEEKLNSAVERPAHYQFPGGVQPIDIAKHLNFNLGNVVKYVSRAGRKGAALEDLEKAAYYLNLEIATARAEQDNQ